MRDVTRGVRGRAAFQPQHARGRIAGQRGGGAHLGRGEDLALARLARHGPFADLVPAAAAAGAMGLGRIEAANADTGRGQGHAYGVKWHRESVKQVEPRSGLYL
jgi:hypothetical protein